MISISDAEKESTNNEEEDNDKSPSEPEKDGEERTNSFLTADEKEYIKSHSDRGISKLYEDCQVYF
jgi:hypothetical protein